MESKRAERVLRRRSDFVQLRDKGLRSSVGARWISFYSHENSTGHLRVGFTLGRKVGSAVLRNRLRRWGREFFRRISQSDSQMGVDINVVFRPMPAGFYKELKHIEFDVIFGKSWARLSKHYQAKSTPHDDHL